jgi:thiamine-monophosphate kinase
VGDVGEFPLIEVISKVLAEHQTSSPVGFEIQVDTGDDSAVVSSPTQAWVWSIDTFTDGVHFRRDWSSASEVGRRAIAASVSDVVAMGAKPAVLMVALSAPKSTSVSWVRELAQGMAQRANQYGARIIGGDVSESPVLSLCVSVTGILAPGVRSVTRAGAKPGDVVAVAGLLGQAAAGLALLQAGQQSANYDGLIAAHKAPVIDVTAGERAAQVGATSMIDVSDGLLADLGHIARQSAVHINIESKQISLTRELQDAAAQLGQDPTWWALSGGDDHAIVATFAPDVVLPEGFHRIGEVITAPGEGERGLVTVDGQLAQQPPGYQHYT